MKVTIIESKSIFTPQDSGFLHSGPYPFTHSISPYTGCGFGNSACGSFCYAAHLPSWINAPTDSSAEWGSEVFVKGNAGQLTAETLARMKPETRASLRVFLSPTTDPYQPAEREHKITRSILEAFSKYSEIGLLVIQTRSDLVSRDFDLIAKMPYAWLSMTVETDDEQLLRKLGPVGVTIERRLETLSTASHLGIKTQLCVSPSLPYTDKFLDKIVKVARPDRVIVDTLVAGDGARGERTAQSTIARKAHWDWHSEKDAKFLFAKLQYVMGNESVGWSSAGFCGIPSFTKKNEQLSLF